MTVSEVQHDHFNEFQVKNSSHTKGAIYFVEWAPKIWFFERGRTNCRVTDSIYS